MDLETASSAPAGGLNRRQTLGAKRRVQQPNQPNTEAGKKGGGSEKMSFKIRVCSFMRSPESSSGYS